MLIPLVVGLFPQGQKDKDEPFFFLDKEIFLSPLVFDIKKLVVSVTLIIAWLILASIFKRFLCVSSLFLLITAVHFYYLIKVIFNSYEWLKKDRFNFRIQYLKTFNNFLVYEEAKMYRPLEKIKKLLKNEGKSSEENTRNIYKCWVSVWSNKEYDIEKEIEFFEVFADFLIYSKNELLIVDELEREFLNLIENRNILIFFQNKFLRKLIFLYKNHIDKHKFIWNINGMILFVIIKTCRNVDGLKISHFIEMIDDSLKYHGEKFADLLRFILDTVWQENLKNTVPYLDFPLNWKILPGNLAAKNKNYFPIVIYQRFFYLMQSSINKVLSYDEFGRCCRIMRALFAIYPDQRADEIVDYDLFIKLIVCNKADYITAKLYFNFELPLAKINFSANLNLRRGTDIDDNLVKRHKVQYTLKLFLQLYEEINIDYLKNIIAFLQDSININAQKEIANDYLQIFKEMEKILSN